MNAEAPRVIGRSAELKRVSFRIRRRYFDQIVAGTKKEEIRTDKPYWRKILLGENPPEIAVFVCGKDIHYRWLRGKPYLEDPEKVLGRPLSEQGIKDVLTNPAIITPLGEQAIPVARSFGGEQRGGPMTIIVGYTRPTEVAEHESLVKEIKDSTGESRYDKKQYLADLAADEPGFEDQIDERTGLVERVWKVDKAKED